MPDPRQPGDVPSDLLEEITREILERLDRSGAADPPGGPRCADCTAVGFCAKECQERTALLAANGVARVGASPGIGPVTEDLAPLIDHTLLKPEATEEQILLLCEEAKGHRFASVCVQPRYVRLAARALSGTPVAVCTVVGFPHGANETEVKVFEAKLAQGRGAQEIDMVIPVGAAKSGRWEQVREDISSVVRAVPPPALTKVILETSYLSDAEKRATCEIAKEAGAAFVKTSTGFGPGGATLDDVRLMRDVVGQMVGVKAAGGIRDPQTARQMVRAGATRIGASASVRIVTEERQ
jgi:deoxyribose-phosphate aldolase